MSEREIVSYSYSSSFLPRLLATGIIPFLYLSCLNLLIYTKMRQNSLSSVRSRFSCSLFLSFILFYFTPVTSLILIFHRSKHTKKAGNLAAILIVIGWHSSRRSSNRKQTFLTTSVAVLVFLISNIPRLVLNLTEFVIHNDSGAGEQTFLFGENVNIFL